MDPAAFVADGLEVQEPLPGDVGNLAVGSPVRFRVIDAGVEGEPPSVPSAQEPAPVTAAELAEALREADANGDGFDPNQPRWPAGTPEKGGQWVQVGQRFAHGGKVYEIAHLVGGKVYANVVSDNAADAATVAFTPEVEPDTGHNVVKGMADAPVMPLIGGGHNAGASKGLVTIDPYVDSSTHDPSIPIPSGSKIKPEEWERFGRVDQENYVYLMKKFGPHASGKAQEVVNAAYKKYDKTVQDLVKGGYHSQFGSSSGFSLSLLSPFNGVVEAMKLKSLYKQREKALRLQADHKEAVQWDLYNRVRAPDLTMFHRSGQQPSWWKNNVLSGKQPAFSGLSQSFKFNNNKGFGYNVVASSIGIRHVLMATFSAHPLGSAHFAGELEVSIPEQLKLDDRSIVFNENEIPAHAKSWLSKMTGSPASGSVLEMFKGALNGSVDLPVPPASAELQMQGTNGKSWIDPPSDVGTNITLNEKGDATGKVLSVDDLDFLHKDASGKAIAKPAKELRLKPGDFIQGMQGTKYVIVADPNDTYGFGFRYVKLVNGQMNNESYNFEGGGVKTFYKLDGHYEFPKPTAEATENFDPAAWVTSAEQQFVGKLKKGDIFKLDGVPYELQADGSMQSAKVSVKSLETGKLGTINTDYKTYHLVPSGTSSEQLEEKLSPQVGDWLAYEGKKATVTKVLKDGTIQLNTHPGVVKLSPDDAVFEGLFRPDDWEIGPKQKAGSLAEGQIVHLSAGAKLKPWKVTGKDGKQVSVMSLETGEETKLSAGKSVSVLSPVVKDSPSTEPPGVVEADVPYESGDEVPVTPQEVIPPPQGEPKTTKGIFGHYGYMKTGGQFAVGDVISKSDAAGHGVFKIVGGDAENGWDYQAIDMDTGELKTATGEDSPVVTLFPDKFMQLGPVFVWQEIPKPGEAPGEPAGELGPLAKIEDLEMTGGTVKGSVLKVGDYFTLPSSNGKYFWRVNGITPEGKVKLTHIEAGNATSEVDDSPIDGLDIVLAKVKDAAAAPEDPAAEPSMLKKTVGEPITAVELDTGDLIQMPGGKMFAVIHRAPGLAPGQVSLKLVSVSDGKVTTYDYSEGYEFKYQGHSQAAVAPHMTAGKSLPFGGMENWEASGTMLTPKEMEPGQKFLGADGLPYEYVGDGTKKSKAGKTYAYYAFKHLGTGDEKHVPKFTMKGVTYETLQQKTEVYEGGPKIPAAGVNYSPDKYTGWDGESVELGELPDGAIFVTGFDAVYATEETKVYQKIGTDGPYAVVLDVMAGEKTLPISLQADVVQLTPKQQGTAIPHEDLVQGDLTPAQNLVVGDEVKLPGEDTIVEVVGHVSGPEDQKVVVASVLPGGQHGLAQEVPESAVVEVVNTGGLPSLSDLPFSGDKTPDIDSLPWADSFVPYTSAWGSGGKYKHHKVNEMPEGAVFQGKDGSLFKVKMTGPDPVVTDGESLFRVKGDLRGRVVDKHVADGPPLGTAGDWVHAAVQQNLVDNGVAGTPKSLGYLKPGDLFTKENYHGEEVVYQLTGVGDELAIAKNVKTGESIPWGVDVKPDKLYEWHPPGQPNVALGDTVEWEGPNGATLTGEVKGWEPDGSLSVQFWQPDTGYVNTKLTDGWSVVEPATGMTPLGETPNSYEDIAVGEWYSVHGSGPMQVEVSEIDWGSDGWFVSFRGGDDHIFEPDEPTDGWVKVAPPDEPVPGDEEELTVPPSVDASMFVSGGEVSLGALGVGDVWALSPHGPWWKIEATSAEGWTHTSLTNPGAAPHNTGVMHKMIVHKGVLASKEPPALDKLLPVTKITLSYTDEGEYVKFDSDGPLMQVTGHDYGADTVQLTDTTTGVVNHAPGGSKAVLYQPKALPFDKMPTDWLQNVYALTDDPLVRNEVYEVLVATPYHGYLPVEGETVAWEDPVRSFEGKITKIGSDGWVEITKPSGEFEYVHPALGHMNKLDTSSYAVIEDDGTMTNHASLEAAIAAADVNGGDVLADGESVVYAGTPIQPGGKVLPSQLQVGDTFSQYGTEFKVTGVQQAGASTYMVEVQPNYGGDPFPIAMTDQLNTNMLLVSSVAQNNPFAPDAVGEPVPSSGDLEATVDTPVPADAGPEGWLPGPAVDWTTLRPGDLFFHKGQMFTVEAHDEYSGFVASAPGGAMLDTDSMYETQYVKKAIPGDELPVDASPSKSLLPFKSAWGSGGKYKHEKIGALPVGAWFQDKSGEKFRVVGHNGKTTTYEDEQGEQFVTLAGNRVKEVPGMVAGTPPQVLQAVAESVPSQMKKDEDYDAVQPGSLKGFGSVWGSGGKYKHEPLSSLQVGETFKDSGHKGSGFVVLVKLPDGSLVYRELESGLVRKVQDAASILVRRTAVD